MGDTSLYLYDKEFIKGQPHALRPYWLMCNRCGRGQPLESFASREEEKRWMRLHDEICKAS